MLKYARDVKRMKLAGYRVARLLFMQGMVSLRVAHPLLARQGQDTGHCSSVTNVVYTEYSKHGGARRYVQLRITFFSFVCTYIYVCTKYICIYEKKRVTVGSLDYPEAEQGWKISPRPTKKRKERPGKDGSRTEPDGAGYRAIHLVQTTTS